MSLRNCEAGGSVIRGHLLFCLLAISLTCPATAEVDEIDEILKTEKMAYEATLAEEAAMSEPAMGEPAMGSGSKTAPARASKSTTRLERELRAARNEIATLRRQLADQEIRHRSELLHSHYNMGCVYKAARQFERAESEFLQALQISPDDPGVHFNLGILYDDDLDEVEKARFHYNKYVELAPNDRDVPRVMEWLATMEH